MKIKEIIKKYNKWIILFLCSIFIILIIENVLDKEIIRFDIKAYDLVKNYLISDQITPIAKAITKLGDAIVIIIISIILSIIIKNKKKSIIIWINAITITILNENLKNIVKRPRPTEFRIIDESGYSFPSGHSTVSAAFYGFIIYLIYKNIENKKIKYTLITILMILIGMIGVSRIYLGVHYTSDVIAGFLLSIVYLVIFTHLIKTNKNSTLEK